MSYNQHQATQYLEIIGPNHSVEVEVVIDFTYCPGCKETGPTYACGGTPAEPASVEDIEFKAYEVVKNAEGKWVTGPQIEMSPWLEAFIEKAIDEDELLSSVSDYEVA